MVHGIQDPNIGRTETNVGGTVPRIARIQKGERTRQRAAVVSSVGELGTYATKAGLLFEARIAVMDHG